MFAEPLERLAAVREVDGWRLVAMLGHWAGRCPYDRVGWISDAGTHAVLADAWHEADTLEARVGWSVLDLATGEECARGETVIGDEPAQELWFDDDGDAIYARDEGGRAVRIDLPGGEVSPTTARSPDPPAGEFFGRMARPEAVLGAWVALSATGRYALARGSLPGERGALARVTLATGDVRWWHAGHADALHDLAFDRTGARLATASRDGTAGVWNLPDASRAWTFEPEPLADLATLRFSGDGRRLMGWNGADLLSRWDLVDGLAAPSLELPLRGLSRIALAQDGDLLATLDSSARCGWLWDLRGARPQRTRIGLPWLTRVDDLAFARDRDALRLVGRDETRVHVATLDLHRRARTVVARLPPAPTATATAVPPGRDAQLDADGARVLVSGRDRAVWLDARTGLGRGTIADGDAVARSFALCARGLARATQTRVEVWDDDGRRVLALDLRPLRDLVTAVALSPDATRLAVGTALGVALVWSRAGCDNSPRDE